jgi:hypothetical protein
MRGAARQGAPSAECSTRRPRPRIAGARCARLLQARRHGRAHRTGRAAARVTCARGEVAWQGALSVGCSMRRVPRRIAGAKCAHRGRARRRGQTSRGFRAAARVNCATPGAALRAAPSVGRSTPPVLSCARTEPTWRPAPPAASGAYGRAQRAPPAREGLARGRRRRPQAARALLERGTTAGARVVRRAAARAWRCLAGRTTGPTRTRGAAPRVRRTLRR